MEPQRIHHGAPAHSPSGPRARALTVSEGGSTPPRWRNRGRGGSDRVQESRRRRPSPKRHGVTPRTSRRTRRPPVGHPKATHGAPLFRTGKDALGASQISPPLLHCPIRSTPTHHRGDACATHGCGKRVPVVGLDTFGRGAGYYRGGERPPAGVPELEMDSPLAHVFVSYSRADRPLVTPIVQVIRAVGVEVFQDVDSIPPGKRWRPVVEETIESADIVLVFWCVHSQCSHEVRKEWQRALDLGKDIVPVLLDSTPILGELAEYQAIDLRYYVRSLASHQLPLTRREIPKVRVLHLQKPRVKLGMGDDRAMVEYDHDHVDILAVDEAATVAAKVLAFLKDRAAAQRLRLLDEPAVARARPIR